MTTLWVLMMGKWSYWDRGYTNVGTQKIWSVQDSQCNVIVSLIKRRWCLDREMIETVWICLGPKINYHCILTAVMQVSMFEWRGGYRQGAKFEFLSMYLDKFHTFMTWKLFKSDKISLSVFKNTTVWGKICGQNVGESEQWKCSYATPMHLPPSLSEHWYLCNSLTDFSR